MSATKSLLWGGGIVLAALLELAGAARAADVAGARAAIDRGLDAQYSHIEALYKDIHSHPELGFQETRTAARLAAEMRALGYEVTEGVGKTGIVALYRNGPGPTVMVRTELDAVPLPEKTGLPYASTATQMLRDVETPVAHACGHDIHMSVWVAVAKTLAGHEGPVERHGHVRRPAGRRGRRRRQGHGDRRPVHALSQARHGLCPACRSGPLWLRVLSAGSHQLDRPTACRCCSPAGAATARGRT